MEILNDTTVWDNTNIYQSIDDPKISEDLNKAKELISSQSSNAELISKALDSGELKDVIGVAREMSLIGSNLSIILRTLGTYISTTLSVDSSNSTAKALRSNYAGVAASKSKVYSSLSVLGLDFILTAVMFSSI